MQNSLRQNEKKENPENIKQIDKRSFRKRKAITHNAEKKLIDTVLENEKQKTQNTSGK